MRNFVAGLVVGALLGGIVVGAVLYRSQSAKYEQGRHQGYFDGGLYVVQQLDRHFANHKLSAGLPANVVDTIEFKDRQVRVVKEGQTLTIETR
jgi:hypothetical protein